MEKKLKSVVVWKRTSTDNDDKYEYNVEVKVAVVAEEGDEFKKDVYPYPYTAEGEGAVSFHAWVKGPRGGYQGLMLGPSFSPKEWDEITLAVLEARGWQPIPNEVPRKENAIAGKEGA